MNFLIIDQEKCKRDGICAETCPMGLIEQKDDMSFPSPIDEAQQLCIQCGHCVAVCPYGALSLNTMSPKNCMEIRKDWILNPGHVEHFLRHRRSIRVYNNKQVEKETMSKLIEIARFAPSGHNMQPVEWLVIYDSAEVQKLAGIVIDWMRYMIKEQPGVAAFLHMDRVVDRWEKGKDTICRNAPHIIIAHASKEDRSASSASDIALAYLELAAPSFGLGACWAGFFNAAATLWPPMQKSLPLPDNHVALGTMMLGYPKYKYYRMPERKAPKIVWR